MKKTIPFFLLLSSFVVSACSGTYQGTRTSDASRIRPGDVVEIKFSRYADFDQTLIVDPDGKISLHAVGDVAVADMTQEYLRDLLRQKYTSLLANPRMQVEIIRANNFQIYVGGELKQPGIVKFNGNLSIPQGIQLAGGLKESTSDHEIMIFRRQGDRGMKVHKFELKAGHSLDSSATNFVLAPYDVVFVVKSLFSDKSPKTLI